MLEPSGKKLSGHSKIEQGTLDATEIYLVERGVGSILHSGGCW